MSANPVRMHAITQVQSYTPPPFSFDPGEEPGEVFGENVFSLLDLDGNGELELEEFRLAFTGLAAP